MQSLPNELIEAISIRLHPHDFDNFWKALGKYNTGDPEDKSLLFSQDKCLQRFVQNHWMGLRRLDWTRLGTGFRSSALGLTGFSVDTLRTCFPRLFIWASDVDGGGVGLDQFCIPFHSSTDGVAISVSNIFKAQDIRVELVPEVHDALMGMILLRKNTGTLSHLLNCRHAALQWCIFAKDLVGFDAVIEHGYNKKLPQGGEIFFER